VGWVQLSRYEARLHALREETDAAARADATGGAASEMQGYPSFTASLKQGPQSSSQLCAAMLEANGILPTLQVGGWLVQVGLGRARDARAWPSSSVPGSFVHPCISATSHLCTLNEWASGQVLLLLASWQPLSPVQAPLLPIPSPAPTVLLHVQGRWLRRPGDADNAVDAAAAAGETLGDDSGSGGGDGGSGDGKAAAEVVNLLFSRRRLYDAMEASLTTKGLALGGWAGLLGLHLLRVGVSGWVLGKQGCVGVWRPC